MPWKASSKTIVPRKRSMNTNPQASLLKRCQMILHWVEDGILVGLLLLMIGLAVLHIVLRNLLTPGPVWSVHWPTRAYAPPGTSRGVRTVVRGQTENAIPRPRHGDRKLRPS